METSDALLLIGGVAVLFVVIYFWARNEIVRRRLTCPRTGESADVNVKQRFEGDGKPVQVKSCSLLDEPTEVDCEQDCIKSG